jgi:hypothetical protein
MTQFYSSALGWSIAFSDSDFGLVEGEGVRIGFGRIERFEATPWPERDGAKRCHLDLQVDSLDSASERLCALGASQPAFQPGADC